MAFELVYTSAPEGLQRGSSGFCVVACTKGLGPRLVVTLEGLSAYKPLYAHYADNAWDNPVSRSHYLYDQAGETMHILSRVCFNGVDHTQRSNKLASHLVLSRAESLRAQGGPADLLGHEELFKDASWQIHPEEYLKQREVPATSVPFKRCALWEKVTGDAGWGGFLAEKYLEHPDRSIYLVYAPEQHQEILPLLQEVLALLPEEKRWNVTFNTYFVTLPAGMQCAIRCCVAGSEALLAARRSPLNTVIDLMHLPDLSLAGKYVDIARSGKAPEAEKAVIATPESPLHRSVDVIFPANNAESLAQKSLRESVEDEYSQVASTMQSSASASHRGRWIMIVALLLVLGVSIGVGWWGISFWRQRRQDEDELRSKCFYLRERYDKLNGSITLSGWRRSADIPSLIEKLQNQQHELAEIERDAEELTVHRNFFDDEKTEFGMKTPDDLIAQCRALSKQLQAHIDALNARMKKEAADAEKRRQEEKNEKKAPAPKPGEIVKPQKSEDGKKVGNEPQKPPPPTRFPLKGDEKYYWCTCQDGLQKNKPVSVRTNGKGGIVIFVDKNDKIELGKSKFLDNGCGETVNVVTRQDADGTVTIESEGAKLPCKIVIKQGSKIYPLCFVLGVSELKMGDDNCLKLTFNKDDSYTIDFPLDLKFPKFWYYEDSDGNFRSCEPELELEGKSEAPIPVGKGKPSVKGITDTKLSEISLEMEFWSEAKDAPELYLIDKGASNDIVTNREKYAIDSKSEINEYGEAKKKADKPLSTDLMKVRDKYFPEKTDDKIIESIKKMPKPSNEMLTLKEKLEEHKNAQEKFDCCKEKLDKLCKDKYDKAVEKRDERKDEICEELTNAQLVYVVNGEKYPQKGITLKLERKNDNDRL